MSLFSFLKEAGEKILDAITPGDANASGEALKEHISAVGLGNPYRGRREGYRHR